MMSTGDNHETTREDKHLKADDDKISNQHDGPLKAEENKLNNVKRTTVDEVGKVTSKLDILKNYDKTKNKADKTKEFKPVVARPLKHLKQGKLGYTNKSIPHRDAETMTDLLQIFENPSDSTVLIFKSSPAHLRQEIEVMTDLSGDDISGEIGLREMETTTDDLAKTVLEMTHDLDYLNLKLLEDERERKELSCKDVHPDSDDLNGKEIKLPEKSEEIYENLLERIYVCIGIAPEEIREHDVTAAQYKKVFQEKKTEMIEDSVGVEKREEKEEEENIEIKFDKQGSVKSEEIESFIQDESDSMDTLSQLRCSSIRSTITQKESFDYNDEIVEHVEEDIPVQVTEFEDKKQKSIESLKIIENEVEEKISDKDVKPNEDFEEIDEIDEGIIYSDLYEAYQFKELFNIDEDEVFVEENLDFESDENFYEEEVRASNEGWFHIKGAEEIEPEESVIDILVKTMSADEVVNAVDEESGINVIYDNCLLSDVKTDQEYHNTSEMQFIYEDMRESIQEELYEVLPDTTDFDRVVGNISYDYQNFFIDIDLNYPEYDDQWEIDKVIEALSEDQSVGKILRDFGFYVEAPHTHHPHATFNLDVLDERHSSPHSSYLDEISQFADNVADLSAVDCSTSIVTNQFRVSMIYDDERSIIDRTSIHNQPSHKKDENYIHIESWQNRQSRRTTVLDIDRSPYIIRTEDEYDRDLDQHDKDSDSVDDINSLIIQHSSDDVAGEFSESSSDAYLTKSLMNYQEKYGSDEGYPKILDQIRKSSRESGSLLKTIYQTDHAGKQVSYDDSVSLSLDNEDIDDDDDDYSSNLETNLTDEPSYSDDPVDVIYELIKSDPYGSYISHKMLQGLKYFKTLKFENEIPQKLKALEALLVKKAARKKFTETLISKSGRSMDQNWDSYTCKPELFNDSVSVLVWNIFNCFFLPISSKLPLRDSTSHCSSSKGKKQITTKVVPLIKEPPRKEYVKTKNIPVKNDFEITIKPKKPLVSSYRHNVMKLPSTYDEEHHTIAIQTDNEQNEIQTPNEVDLVRKVDDFVIIRRYRTMEVQTDVSFVAKIKEEEALFEKTFAIHNHVAAQTVEFSPDFAAESFTSLAGTIIEEEEDEYYWKNVEKIFTNDTIVRDQLTKIGKEKGRKPIELLITVGKDGKKLFAPLRSEKGLVETMDPRLEQFLSVLQESSVCNLLEDLLEQPSRTDISKVEKEKRASEKDIQIISEHIISDKSRKNDLEVISSAMQLSSKANKSYNDFSALTLTDGSELDEESRKTISECEEKERHELEDLIKTGIEFLEESDVDEVSDLDGVNGDDLSELSERSTCHSSIASLKRFYLSKFLDSLETSSSFTSVITISEVDEFDVEFISDSGAQSGRIGEKTILKGGLQDQKKSVTIFKEIVLKESMPIYVTDKDYQEKKEVKPVRNYISFRRVPKAKAVKPLVVKNWLVKNEKNEWIMVKQYHLFKRIHNYPDMYGSFDETLIQEEARKLRALASGLKPIRGILYSYFFPKNALKFGISAKDRENIEYLRKSDVAWNKITQKNPERDPYHRNYGLPQAFTKNFMKIEKHSSIVFQTDKPEQSLSITASRSESIDSNYEFIQLMKMEESDLSADVNVSEKTKLDLDSPVHVLEQSRVFEPELDEEVDLEESTHKTFTIDELQNILVDLLIENFVDYDIDCFNKPQLKPKDVEEIPGIEKSSVDKTDSQIIKREEPTLQKLNSDSKTKIIKSDSIDTITDNLSLTESELQLICSQTLRAKRISETSDAFLENKILSRTDLKELVNLLSGYSSVIHSDPPNSSSSVDEVYFHLEKVDCLHQVFSSVERIEGTKNIVHVSNLQVNHVVKFVKLILKELYRYILSLAENVNIAASEDNRVNRDDVLGKSSEEEKRNITENDIDSKVEFSGSVLLYLGEIFDKVSHQEYSANNKVDEIKTKFVIFVAYNDLEIIREKFVELSLPLVKLLKRKDLSYKFPPVLTRSETSLLNMIYLNEHIRRHSDESFESDPKFKDSLIDLIHTVQKHLSRKFSDSSIVDMKMALHRFENDWMSRVKLNNQIPEKCAIAAWAEHLCSSKHYSQSDKNNLKEVLRTLTNKIDHVDKLEEYLETKSYAKRLSDDEISLEKEIEIFDNDEKTRETLTALKNILINRILSAEDLFLSTGHEPSISEVTLVSQVGHPEIVEKSLIGFESKNEEYSESGDLLETKVSDTSLKKVDQKLLEPTESVLVPFTIPPSKFPYLKKSQTPFLRKINKKARRLLMDHECQFGASKRIKSFRLQKSKISSIVEKCVGKVDFKTIHDRQATFSRKLLLIWDKKMMYNTYFSYGIGNKTAPLRGRTSEVGLEEQIFCRDDERSVLSRCEACLDTPNSSVSSLSYDLRHPLFSVDTSNDTEAGDRTDNENDECNKKLEIIREEIKKAKNISPLKEKYIMPNINEVDSNDLAIAHMSNILNRRVRHLKNIVSGNLTHSISSLPSLGSIKTKGRSISNKKTEVTLPYLTNLPEIPDISDIKSAKLSTSHTSNEKLSLPPVVDAAQRDMSVVMEKSPKEHRPSAKLVPTCVKLSKSLSDQNNESRQTTRRSNDNYRLVASLKCDYRVRRDLMNLLEEPKKLPYLKPPPEYTPIPGFKGHPLRTFKLDESHVAQVHSFRLEKALKKAQFYKFSNEGDTGNKSDVDHFMDPTKCITQPPLFPVNVVPRIMQKQVQSQCERYKETVESCIAEAKSIYDTLMFNKAVYDILKVNDKPLFVHDVKLDVGGKTKNHAHFMEKRKRVRDLFLIGHKLLRETYNSLLENIPNIFVDFSRYRDQKEYWDLEDLYRTILTDLKNGCEHFCTVWYVRLDENFRKPEVLKEMSCDKIKRFMRLVSLILSYEISTAVDRTLTNFTDVFCDKFKIPRIMFKTTLETTEFKESVDLHFCISPELEDIYKVVFDCLHCIFNIGQDLPMLFMPECKPIKRYHKTKIKFIDTNKQDFVLPVNLPVLQNVRLYENCRKMLNDCLEDNFSSIRSYINTLEHSYAFLTYSQYATSTSTFLNNDNTTKEDVIDLLNIFKDYSEKIIRMLPFATFNMGLVEQESAFKFLSIFVNDYIVCCVQAVGRFLKEDYYSMKKEFDRVKSRALKPAITSEELVALGEFMSFVQTRWMRDRSQLIVTLSRYYWTIYEYFIMPYSDYKESLTDWFLWYLEMFPIFDQFATLYEQTKFEFDEKLRDTMSLIEEKRIELVNKLPLLNNLNDVTKIVSYKQFVKRFLRDIEFITAQIEWVNNEEKIYNRTITKFGLVEELNNILLPLCKLIFKVYSWYQKRKTWLNNSFDLLITEEVETAFDRYYNHYDNIYSWYQKRKTWLNNSFDLLITEEVETAFDRYYKDLLEMSKDLKILCRSLEKDELKYGVFKGSVDAEDELQLPAPLILCYTTLNNLKEFQPILQLVTVICNKDLLERHWNEMSEIVGHELAPNAGMSLLKYVDFDLFNVIDKLEIISSGATKELQLQENLRKMYEEWKDLEFSVSKFKETDISILTGVDDIQALLDDHIVKTLAMRSSPFSKPVENEVKIWYDKLVRINRTIDVWGKVQVEWLHLYPIFTSEDIKQQMPKEAKFFADVDTRFRNAIKLLLADRRAIVVGPAEGLLESLEVCLQLMEEINNGVNLYLETKRLYFPRFFFLSNDEMLEILSQTTDPLRVQPHLKKCFEGIACLGFNESLDIYSMMSSEKEEITFIRKVSTKAARGSVEKWLVQVEKQMLRSVRHVIKDSFNACKYHERKQWVRAWPGQVVLCVSQAFWTAEVHRVLRKQHSRAVHLYHKKLNKQLSDVIQLVRGKLTMMARITLGALVVLDVHSKDVTYGLYVKGIINESDFEWMAQLRYYWEHDMVVSITNASVAYAYEYLGNTARLVITPLTDRCYRTLVGAYHLHLNGAPEGPAGTGKTETTKDLAKALAVQCIVFNCSDGLDYIAMGKFFKGLASCGAWACFDEFNRIEVEVLSVVAQQILCIIQAVRKNVKEFVFEGTTLQLNPACYVCITMNPGYAGRSELPDNLKVLFRTVAMMVPDYGLIGEISLYSYGFINARKLSEKIVTTYRLCSEQLSSQSHYDYGMRAVKTVLQAAGNLKLKFPKQSEEVLLLRSIMDVNLPKFLNHDVPLFEGIISDLFPGVKLPTPNYDKFIGAIKQSCEQHNLQPSPPFITKIIQTYEMMVVRHGFMLVGDPFSGKTSTLHVLADAITLLTDRKRVVKYQTLNPKSVTMGQLYGRFDDVSHEWSDGVLANAFREFAMSTSDERKWVIFDGPVDAVWIENMNTVLDDNKKLCLNSGEVMSMTWSMSMIFEVMDLAQASPATVSRCGMIYMESSTLGWAVLVDSWLTSLPESIAPHADTLESITKWIIPPCLTFCRKHCTIQLNAGVSNTVRSFCNYITVFLNSAIMEQDVNQFNANALSWIQAAVLLSAIWGFSGTLDADSRIRFDVFFKELVQGQNEEHEPPEAMSKLISSVPTDGTWEDNLFMFKGRGFWSSWAEVAQTAKIAPLDNLSQLVVPTLETVKYQYIIEKLVHNFLPVCLMGPTGTGKSFYIDDLITTRLSLEKFEPSSMTFTVNTQPNLVQTVVLSKLIKRKKSIFGPPLGKHCLIFIDDMNMPAKEVYGAQPPLELLRMYFDHGYWFDLKDMNKIFVEDLFFIAAMGPAGGSRQDVYARFLRHFCLLSINLFPEPSMTKIYTTLLLEAMRRKGFGVDFLNLFRATVTASIDVYQKSILNLLPTPAKSHYTFNLRDISRVINGVMMFNKDSYRDKPDFISLWLHEMLRVFSDRLVESNDRKWFFSQLKESVKSNFRITMEEALKDMKHEGNEVTEEDMTNLMFTSIFDLDNQDDKLYEQVVDMEPFTKIIQDNLDTYNQMHKTKIDIVLFRYALVHLSRILRLLSMPGGNGLLVGVAGSGRQSLTKLAASVFRLAVFQPEIKELYEFNEWRDDLKVVMKECGGRGNPMVFLFTENQIKHEYFLQDIDVLLNTGEVPNIFSLEETQEVLELARLGAQGGNRNLDVHPLSVLSYFRSQCKRNIHLMICFSPIGNTFRNRIRLYPAFVNCCTIDWFEDWPENALEMVAGRYFDNDKFDAGLKQSLVNACKYFHVTTRQQAEEFFLNTGRKTYITSGSYLNLIRLYTNLFDVKQKEVMEAKMRYVIGLDSLQFAADQISVMKQELEALQPALRRAAEAAEAMMREINGERAQVEAATQLVQRDEVVAEAKAAQANLLKQECQVELAATIPILNESVAALNTLKPNDITVVKAMKNPPKAVKLVMAAVCIMMGIKAAKVPDPNFPGRFKMDFWIPSVRLLGNINFLKNLKEYDKDNISPAVISVIRRDYIPNKEFNPAVVKKASKAAEGLCKWVIAMEQYDEVIKIVAPKKERMEKAEEEYERTMQELNDKKALLRGFEEKLAVLQERLRETEALKAQLTQEAYICWEKLQRAQQLIGGLGGEKERWTEAANSLQRSYNNLAGDVLLSSAFVAYLGPFTTAYRHPLISNWKQKTGELSIPCSSDFDFIRLVGKDYVIQQWHIDGLPKDKFSVENGVVMANTNRYTFLIDPEGQANRWLKTMYMDSNMEVLKISDAQLMRKVETGIVYGQPVLLEDVGEELDACLDPILLKLTFRQGGRDYITIGTKVIELHKDFNLFITTRLRCPHFLPEVLNKVTVINFALTKEALEDQLLAIAITILSPELEARRASMIVQTAMNATALRNAEEDILKALSAPDKNVLEDENTITILNESQKIAADIKEREKGTIETSGRILEFNTTFAQPVTYARSLYYCLTDLPNIDPMYHFSLPWFLRIYSGSLKADYDHFLEISNKPVSMRKNARFMPNMTFSLYSNVCRSLFEKDKLLFSFILCTNLMLTESKIRMEDLTFLLTGGVVLVNLIPNPAPEWMLVRSWDELCRLTLLEGFQGLKEHVETNLAEWRMYYDKSKPHLEPLPEPWNSALTPFQKLLVLRIFHLDKMVPAIRNFVEFEMDESFVTPPLFDIAESYKDSNKVTPMIFILSPGVDPMSALQQFAEKMSYKEHEFESVSLGQGQGPIAENLIKKARMAGTWVCLQNCHLATSWMPTLEAICDDLVFSTKDGFRLWLTSYPSEKFPVPILQNGVKMTNEPPTGLKQNMLRTFTSEPITDEEFYLSCSADGQKQFVFARLLFGLTFFHAVVLERKKYGPIGWNIPYGFNESDYNISVLQLQEYMMESEEVPFEAVTYLTGECNYGGRVTDNWDRRTLNTILASFVNAHIAANLDYYMLDNFSELIVNADRHEFDYYISIIENISDVQPAEVVGLNSNASISRDFQSTKALFEAMQLVQPKARGGGSSRKEDEMVVTITSDILRKLPPAFELDVALQHYPVNYAESMNTVLVQEMERFNRLTGVVRSSIRMLQRAIKGEAVMTPDLEATFNSVLANRLPAAWAKVSYPSLKALAEYVADLIHRLGFLQDWFKEGIPASFWVSGFFFTQAFLTAAMQNYARKHVIPIDLLTFDFVMTSYSGPDDVISPPADGVYVYGLFLEGARWDRELGQLEEQMPKILFDIMPVIHFVPKQKKHAKEDGRYVCPLYKTSERRGILSTTGHSTNYVLPLLLACSRSPAHWVKRGTALLCQLDN